MEVLVDIQVVFAIHRWSIFTHQCSDTFLLTSTYYFFTLHLLTGSRNLAIHVTQLIFRSHIPDAEYHKIVVGIEELNRYKL